MSPRRNAMSAPSAARRSFSPAGRGMPPIQTAHSYVAGRPPMSTGRRPDQRISPNRLNARVESPRRGNPQGTSTSVAGPAAGPTASKIRKTTVQIPAFIGANREPALSQRMQEAIKVDGGRLKGYLKRTLREEIDEIVKDKVQSAVGVWTKEMDAGGSKMSEMFVKALAPRMKLEEERARMQMRDREMELQAEREREVAVLRARCEELQNEREQLEVYYGTFFREFERLSYQMGNDQIETNPDLLLDWLVDILNEKRNLDVRLDREIQRRHDAEDQLAVEGQVFDRVRDLARTGDLRNVLPRAILLGLDELERQEVWD